VHKGVAMVHVSGHASAGELLYIFNATQPSNVMPVHGEWRHLRAQAALARSTGVPDERIVLADDGVVVDLVDGKAEIVGAVECGYVFVDGLEVGDVGESTLKDRRILGDEGFISITVAVDRRGGVGRPPAGPGRAAGDRALGERHVPAPADDHPGGRRGVTGRPLRSRRKARSGVSPAGPVGPVVSRR
jgi:mRNA degradation ribonuclease J1/J2